MKLAKIEKRHYRYECRNTAPLYNMGRGWGETWLCLSAWQHTAEPSNTLVILILGIHSKEKKKKRHQRHKDIMSSYGLSF